MADVDMLPTDKDKSDTEKKDSEEQAKPPPVTPVDEIKSNIALIERAVTTLEPRFTHRALRTLTALRKKTDESILVSAIRQVYPNGAFRFVV